MAYIGVCLLQKGIELPKGCSHQFRASLVFTAFALEAFLNHIGHNLFKCWDDLERRLGPREKLNIIAERLQVDVNYGILPWQIVKDLFDFRNEIAHGKSKKNSSPDKLITLDNFSDTLFEKSLEQNGRKIALGKMQRKQELKLKKSF